MAQVVAVIVKGGIVMIPLLICSLISLALTIERILFWAKLKSREVLREILTHVEQGEFDQALKLGKTSQQPIARVMAAGIAHRNPAPAKAMEAAAQAEIPVLKSRLGVLDTIVTLAPLLGLLGTVVGMIGSFDVMSEVGIGPTSRRYRRRRRSADRHGHRLADRDPDPGLLQLLHRARSSAKWTRWNTSARRSNCMLHDQAGKH